MNNEIKNKVIMTIIICGVCLILFAVMFMQFRTVEETDITAIENMREAELRTAISEWKSKYEETLKQLDASQKSIQEYQEKIEKNEEASELVDKDLKESNTILGKTDVYGEGVIVTLSGSEEREIKYRDLLELVNELRYAGAEAISINGKRIVDSTCITCAGNVIQINGEKVSSPFEIKAIGPKDQLYGELSKSGGTIYKLKKYGVITNIKKVDNIEIQKDI